MPQRCPADARQTAELFCTRELQSAEARQFQQHLRDCPDCQERVDRVRARAMAARAACGEFGRAFLMPLGA